jgi:hypothetical protein
LTKGAGCVPAHAETRVLAERRTRPATVREVTVMDALS